MKILGLMCSPVKNRNTDTLLQAVLDGAAEAGATTEKIYVNDLGVQPCQDCGFCRTTAGCSLSDGFSRIAGALPDADGVVVGAPTYYGGLAAQCKILIDRCFQFVDMHDTGQESWTFQSRIARRKLLVFVGTNGSFGPGCCRRQEEVVWHLCNDINARLYECLHADRTDYHPVAENSELLARARKLGERLVGAIPAEQAAASEKEVSDG